MESCAEFIQRKNEQFSQGNLIAMKDVGRKGKHFFKREAWTFMPQGNIDKKVFIFERLRAVKTEGEAAYHNTTTEDVEYRIGYYIVGQIGRKKDVWTWGQFCPMIPKNDFEKLIEKAREDGVILSKANNNYFQ